MTSQAAPGPPREPVHSVTLKQITEYLIECLICARSYMMLRIQQ